MTRRLSTRYPVAALADALAVADSGTWGDEANGSSGHPVLRSTNIIDGEIEISTAAWRKIPKNDLNRRKLANGDIIVTKSSGSPDHIGKCAHFVEPHDGRQYYFSNFTLRLRVKDSLASSRYIYHWLTSPDGKAILQSLNNTTTGLRNLNINRYLNQLVPLPPLKEQRRIAAILDKADAIRRHRRQALAEIDNLLRASFLAMFGDELSRAQKDPPLTLGEIVEQDRGISYGVVQRGPEVASGVPIVRISNIFGNQFDGENMVRTAPEIAAQYRRTCLTGGELLLGIRGTVGNVAIVPDLAAGWNVSREIAVIPLREGYDPLFIWSLMLAPVSQRFMTGAIRGIAQRGINLEDVRRLPVPAVDDARIQAFRQVAGAALRCHCAMINAADQSDELLGSVSQRAFQGAL